MTDRMHAYMQTVAMHCEFTRSAREQWERLAVFLVCDPFASGFFSQRNTGRSVNLHLKRTSHCSCESIVT